MDRTLPSQGGNSGSFPDKATILPFPAAQPRATSPTKLIRRYLPTFAWQTLDEIITMFEVLDEDINVASVKIRLWQLAEEGIVEKKTVLRWDRGVGRRTTSMYRLAEKPSGGV